MGCAANATKIKNIKKNIKKNIFKQYYDYAYINLLPAFPYPRRAFKAFFQPERKKKKRKKNPDRWSNSICLVFFNFLPNLALMFPMYIPNYKKKEKFSHLKPNPPPPCPPNPTNIDPQTQTHTQKQQQQPFPQCSVRAEREGEKSKKKNPSFYLKFLKVGGKKKLLCIYNCI